MDIDKPKICVLTVHSCYLLILQQRTDESSDYCNPRQKQHQLWIQQSFPLLQRFRRYQCLTSMPHDDASGAITLIITTPNVKSFVKPFVMIIYIYISMSTIALLAHDRARN